MENDILHYNIKIKISSSQKKYKNSDYYPYCYIIDMKIKNIIQNYVFQGDNLNIFGQKVFAKNNFIYLNASNNIMIGNLDGNFIYVSNYVLFYNSPEILLNEKSILLKSSFSDYLKHKHIKNFISDIFPLKDENNNLIGEIMLIPKNQSANKNKAPIQSSSEKNLNKNNIIQNQSNGHQNPKKNEVALNDKKLNIAHKDNNIVNEEDEEEVNKAIKDYKILGNNYFVEMNLPQKKKSDNEVKNYKKIKEDFDLNQKSKEKGVKQLRKDENHLQKKVEIIQNNNVNKLNNLEKEVENKNKENNDLKKRMNNLEIFNKKEKLIQNQNEIEFNRNNKIKLVEKENDLNEREKRILIKEKEIINKENELKKKVDELNEKKNKLNEREKKILIKEKEVINKENELFEKNNKNQSKLKKRENIILQKEDELIKKETNLIEREKEINNKLKENKNLSQNNKESKDERILMPIPQVETNPLSSYKKPTLIGLNNMGTTSFMNSTLQCLSQTTDLTNYFLKNSKKGRIINNNLAKDNKNSLQLSPIYLKLIQKLWNKKGAKPFSPNEFMNTIEKMNPIFKKDQAGDSKDFIIYILEQLHEELKSKINTNFNIEKDQPLNQYDRSKAFNYLIIF